MRGDRKVRLFRTERITPGGGLDESLLSYVLRLAELNCVGVGTLLAEAAPRSLGKARTVTPAKIKWLMGSATNRGAVLEELNASFFSENLVGGTMEVFRAVAADSYLRPLLKWNPRFLASRKSPYYPLYWHCNAVRVCADTGSALRSLCHECGWPQPTVATAVRLGECSRCGAQLEDEKDAKPEPWDPVVCGLRSPRFERWCAEQVRQFVEYQASGEMIDALPLGDTLLWWLSDRRYPLRQCAGMMGISIDDVCRWLRGKLPTKLTVVLEVCWKLGVGIVDFLRRKHPSDWRGLPYDRFTSLRPLFLTEETNCARISDIASFLQRALKRGRNREESLVEVCVQTFGASTSIAYRYCPDLAWRFTQRFLRTGRSREDVERSMATWEAERIGEWLENNKCDAGMQRISEHHSNPTMVGRR